MPALADRGGDILLLARHFLSGFAQKINKPIKGISETAALKLTTYGWPGNIRELQNVIERAVVLSVNSVIDLDDLPGFAEMAEKTKKPALKKIPLAEIEKAHIEAILKSENWNMRKSADILGIHRNTLRQKIKDYNLQPEE